MRKHTFKYIILFSLCYACQNNNFKQHQIIPVDSSVNIDYSESVNSIVLKWNNSSITLNERYYEMYADDSLTKKIKEENDKIKKMQLDSNSIINYSKKNLLEFWLKEKLLKIKDDKIFVSYK